MRNHPAALPTQVFSYVVDKVLGGKLWPREWVYPASKCKCMVHYPGILCYCASEYECYCTVPGY